MKTQGINTRLCFIHSQGKEFGYIYEHSLADILSKEQRTSNYDENFLNVGDEIILDSKKYRIVEINTKIYPTLNGIPKYGINSLGRGELLEFNFQVTYIVE